MTRLAINGMGRLGRAAFKQIIDDGVLPAYTESEVQRC